jgi:glucose-6-phosphate-specific signal transduction histidine kinase
MRSGTLPAFFTAPRLLDFSFVASTSPVLVHARPSHRASYSEIVPLLLAPVLVILAVIALIPVSLVQRYRMATSRQRARGWLIAINLAGLLLSALLFIASAAITSVWIPNALTYTAAGLGAGCLLGIFGLALTRWEPGPGSLHYTPNRLLVLAITLVVTARLAYGFWRGVHTWRAGMLSDSGVAGSMAAGAVVLGYYLAFWFGVRRRFKRIGR